VPSFSLGGSNGFAAYGENEPLPNQYYILQAGYLRKLAQFPVLLGEGLHTSMARPKSERSFRLHSNPKFRPDTSVAMMINTIFDPVESGGPVGTGGHRR
jgi:hypothetical protein